MWEVYVGKVDPKTSSLDIERAFQAYGEIRRVKLPRSFSGRGGYAFVEFEDRRDALFAIYAWSAKSTWRVELSRKSQATFGGGNAAARFAYNNLDRPSAYAQDIKNKGVKESQRGRMKKNQVTSTSIWKPVPPPPPPWLQLPEDITVKILRKLKPIDILRTAQNVCTTWRKICRDPTMWRVIDMWKLREVGGFPYFPNGFNEMVFDFALDLSQGQVTEINIEEFGCNMLLESIAQRCCQLRCLRLAFCYAVSWGTLSKGVGFPLLEELHLQYTYLEKADIEAIGLSCPMLKTFSLNGRGCKGKVLRSSEETLAIAKSMPELRHLQLFGNGMTNEALEAILNGCPKLESLDLRQCLNLNLEGELGRRCAQQMKILRRPHDFPHEYEWDALVPDWVPHGHDNFSDVDSDDDLDYDGLDNYDFTYPYQFDGVSEDLFLGEYFTDPFQFDGGSEDSFPGEYFGSF